jgi:hypothetical protein
MLPLAALCLQVGWGHFPIQAKVHFKPRWGKAPVSLQWCLQFEGSGSSGYHAVDFSKQLQTSERRDQASCIIIKKDS